MHKSSYLIEYLKTPTPKETRLGMWGFIIKVSSDFIATARTLPITQEHKERFLARVKDEVIIRLWDRELYNNWVRVQFEEDTALLWSWAVPGNCACMGNQINNLISDRPYVEYSPHNVDGMKQAMGLLQIFLMWHDWIYYQSDWCKQEVDG